MASFLEEQIHALGAVPVLVVMKDRTKQVPKQLENAFSVLPEREGMLASARMSFPDGVAKGFLLPEESLPSATYYPNLGIMLGTVDVAGLAALHESSSVAMVHSAPVMSLIRPTSVSPVKPRSAVTWGIKAMKVDKLWAKGLTGKDILVGHLDTGVDGAHPALQGAIKHFGVAALMSSSMSEPATAWDTAEHGTHTAGTICARASRSGNKPLHVGVAPGALLAAATVIEGGEITKRIIAGIDWAVGKDIRVINLSLGLRGYWPNFEPIMQVLRDLNVLPVVASGNEGPDTSRSPGNYETVLSVGAVDRRLAVADFSSSQSFARANDPIVPDLVGPGMDIESCAAGGGYSKMDGTSMAAPHIAGLAALLVEAKPNASATEVETAILESCKPTGDRMRTNRGFPNALKALEILNP